MNSIELPKAELAQRRPSPRVLYHPMERNRLATTKATGSSFEIARGHLPGKLIGPKMRSSVFQVLYLSAGSMV
jgi:hypothetical protein